MKNIRIDNPCPMLLGKMQKNGNDFYCKSCDSEVIDFRNKREEEILKSIDSNVCGVFNFEQLSGQQRTPFLKQMIFYCLVIMAFLGFSVKSLQAQSNGETDSSDSKKHIIHKKSIDNDNVLESEETTDKKEKKEKVKKRGLFGRRERVWIGCPRF